MSNFTKGSVALLIVGILMLVCGFMSITSISPGMSGVIFNRFGGIENEVLGQGWHIVFPWKHVTAYPESTKNIYYDKAQHEGRKVDDSLNIQAKDSKTLNLDIAFTLHMEREKLPHIFTKFQGQDVESIAYGFMKNETYRIINNITSRYTALDILGGKREEINNLLVGDLRKSFLPDGIVIENASISRVEADKETQTAIQQVVNAQNALKSAELERQKAEITADQARIAAQGFADSELIKAQGQAKANKELQLSLTDNIIKSQWVQRWNGQLPTTELSGSSTMVQIKP